MHQTDACQDVELGAKEITISEIETREEALNESNENGLTICETEF